MLVPVLVLVLVLVLVPVLVPVRLFLPLLPASGTVRSANLYAHQGEETGMLRVIGICVLALTFLLSASANAAVTTYPSRATFDQAFQGYTFKFNAYDGSTGYTLVARGVMFSYGNALVVESVDDPFAAASLICNRVSTLKMTQAVGTKAIGFDVEPAYQGDSSSFTLTAAGTAVTSSSAANPTTAFVGLISDTPFTTATLTLVAGADGFSSTMSQSRPSRRLSGYWFSRLCRCGDAGGLSQRLLAN